MQHTVSLKDVVISQELRRRIRKVNVRAETAAMHALANLLPHGSSMVLKRLTQLSVELCGAGSGASPCWNPGMTDIKSFGKLWLENWKTMRVGQTFRGAVGDADVAEREP
jgi:hypothetical protein